MDYDLKPYQDAAVYDEIDGLLSNALRFLKSDKHQRLFVLKSIMGSGKTIIASEFIEALLNSSDKARTGKELCVIWLSKGNAGLHMQSGEKLERTIKDKDIHIYSIRDSSDFNAEKFYDKDVYVINWEKINNLKDGELVNNLFVDSEIRNLRSAKRNSPDVEYIFIIDEFHMNYGTDSYKKIVEFFNPHVIIGMSATPSDDQMAQADAKYTIPVSDVMNEGMVKKGICFNSASDYSDDEITEYDTLDEFFLRLALRQRDLLEEKYRAVGSDVIPLLLIQFNDSKNNEEIIRVRDILDKEYDNNKNNTYAIWISETDNKKDKLRSPEHIIRDLDSNDVRILLFKQAVATGWDCPRAHVLLRYRRVVKKTEVTSASSFDVQTLGRIFRMPEPNKFALKAYKHYDDEDLNYGYVFVPNNGYILEKDFKQAFGDDTGSINKTVVTVDYSEGSQDENEEGTQITLFDVPEGEINATERPGTRFNTNPINDAENGQTAPETPVRMQESHSVITEPTSVAGNHKPIINPTSPKSEAQKYASKYGFAIQKAEKHLSAVNAVALDKRPDDIEVNRAIRDILKDISVQRDIRENDDYTEKITFYGKTMPINDALFQSGEKPELGDSGTSFSVSDTPSVLANKADKLLSELINRKQYSKGVKSYLKRQIKVFFRKQVAGCGDIDDRASAKTSKLILLNERIIRQIIRGTDDAIRELSSYDFKKAPYKFPTSFRTPPKADPNSKGLMHFPLPDTASNPERIFEEILNRPDNLVLLWHKNADHGSSAFCIPYTTRHQIRGKTIELQAPTYPDFLVLFKDGSIGIYEIKDFDKKDDNDLPKSAAILNTVATMNRELSGVKVFGGLVYIDQQTRDIKDKKSFLELI